MTIKNLTKNIKFYKCNVCGNLVITLNDSGLTPICCGRDMEDLEPGTTDGEVEKHVPIWMMDGCKVIVSVGSDPHPMTPEHYIQWIVLRTNKGIYAKSLTPEDEAEACFKLCKNEVVESIYEYCNRHGLWIGSDKEVDDNERPLC